MKTVRLEYGGMRFENDVEDDEIGATIDRMADRHGIALTGPPLKGKVKLTNMRATFSVQPVTEAEAGPFILAVCHHGEKLRDTDIAISVWESREEALAALREDFADELAGDRELGVLADPCGRRNPDTEDGLLEALRWHHNVIVAIDQFPARRA